MPPYNQAYNINVIMSGGLPSRWRAGVPASVDSLTLENATIARLPDPWRGEADIAAHSGGPTAGRSGDHASGISTAPPSSHQSTIPDHILDNPEEFSDAPYMPPRITPAELHAYSALHPRSSNNVYDPLNHVLPSRYPYEGGTSPAESHHSVDSNWSASSSSSASSQRLPHDYLADPSSQYPQNPLPSASGHSYSPHYPAYHGQQRLGLEHIRHGEQPSNVGGPYYRTHPPGYAPGGLVSLGTVGHVGERVDVSSQMSYLTTLSQGSSSSSAIPATNQPSNVPTFSISTTPPTDASRSRFPDAGPYLRQQLGLSPHEPVSLQSLPDSPPGEKPSTPLPMLVKLAIYGSPNKQLTLQEIYNELENRFQWFRDHKHEKAWKNSIRHNLSLNQVFRHVPRPITEPGKGSYWQLDVSGGEGYKRTRKRRPKSRLLVSEEEEEEVSEIDEDRTSPSDTTGMSRLSSTPVEDPNIDPGLRSEGHLVGEGRTRPSTRRAGGGGPYTSQSPRYQQGPLPVVAEQDTSVPGQPPVRFGQPSFGQTSFPIQTQTQPIQVVTTSASFSALSSSTVMAPTTSTAARSQVLHVASYDRTVQIPQPQPPPRAGIEYVMDPGGLPAARRIRPYPEGQGPSRGVTRSSPEGSSSGSSRTWNDARSGPEMQG